MVKVHYVIKRRHPVSYPLSIHLYFSGYWLFPCKSGKSIRHCNFVGPTPPGLLISEDIGEARREIFEKTLAFYCTLISRGCFGLTRDLLDSAAQESSLSPVDSRKLSVSPDVCRGKIILLFPVRLFRGSNSTVSIFWWLFYCIYSLTILCSFCIDVNITR